jgi:hypothetical protein
MGWIPYNEHPYGYTIDDCVLRAIATYFDISWEQAYLMVVAKGYEMKLFPTNMNLVWESMLLDRGLTKYYVPNTCPMCVTVEKFANDHPHGSYILGTTTHAIAVINGSYYDTWDSGQEYPVYYFAKKGEI